MKTTLDFYRNLPAFADFSQVTDLSHFVQAPEDWVVILTDIKGSTKAIDQGRFRDVNLMGAAGIVAVINALPDIAIPYVFGGDGASLLVPVSQLEPARKALEATQKLARDQFQIELRAGAVPVQVLNALQAPVLVGKYQLGSSAALAQFRGGGLAKAEEILKGGHPQAVIFSPPTAVTEANLTGLSCRWEPIPHRRGVILTLLVTSRGSDSESTLIYQELMGHLTRIMGTDLRSLNPVTVAGLAGRVRWRSVLREAKVLARGKSPSIGLILKILLIHFVARIFTRFNLKAKDFDALEYKQSTASHSDFKKFDDMLRMVIDCTSEQAAAVESELEKMRAKNLIWYGTHRSDQALMTCVVFSTGDNHFHFIDGSHGGYALAARKLKESRKSS